MMTNDLSCPGDDKESLTCRNLVGERLTDARAQSDQNAAFELLFILFCELQRGSEKKVSDI